MPTTPTAQEMQELIDLLKQVDGLNDKNARSFAEVAKNAGNVTKETKRLKDELNSVNHTFSSIAQSLKDSIQEFSKYNTTAANTKKTFSSLQSIAAKLLSDQSGYSKLTEKELKKLKEKITLNAQNLTQNLASRQLTTDQAAEASYVLNQTAELVALTEKRLEREREIQKAIGLTGNILKGLSKIPGIGSALDTEQALEDMREFADELKDKGENVNSFSNKLKIAGKGFSTAFGGLKKSLTDPVAILTFIVERALTFNRVSVDIGKNLGTGTKESDRIAKNLANIANNSSNLNITFKNAAEAMSQLNESTGLVANYSADALETQIMLTKQFGLTAEEAAGIYKFSVLTGESSSKVNDEMVGAFVATRNSVKVGANFKQVMAEAAKVSGQLAANFRNNPAAITAAVVQMKALGTSLEQTKNQGSQLLDFESSLENELKAELLTGQQLNLERARAAALAGDQVELAKELSNQGMTLEKFSSMNVLAQNAYAQALGLNADQLSDQLTKQKQAEESGKSLADLTKEQALEAEKRQSIQDKFNAAIEKLQDFFGNLVAGPVGQLLEIITNIVGNITNVLQPALSVVFTPISWALDMLGKMNFLLKAIVGSYLAIKAIQIANNAYKAIGVALLVKEAATEEGKLSIQNLQYLLGKQSLGVKIAAYTMSLKDMAIQGAISIYEKLKLGFQIAQKGAALGYNAILLARQAIMGGELAKAIGIAAAWAIANPFKALIGLGVAAAAGALINSLAKPAGDMISPADGKTQVSTKEGGLFELSPNDDLLAGPGLASGGGISGGSMSIDLTPMVNAIAEVRDAVNKLYSKEGIVNIDGKKVGTLLTQGSYKTA
jgi:hypothetical protein